MNYKNSIETYIYFGKIVFFIFIASFTYVILINVLDIKVECDFKKAFGKECISCGLTRGVFECIKSNYSSANVLNKNSVFYFLYAIWNLQVRFTIFIIQNIYLKSKARDIWIIILIDMLLTLIPVIIYYLI